MLDIKKSYKTITYQTITESINGDILDIFQIDNDHIDIITSTEILKYNYKELLDNVSAIKYNNDIDLSGNIIYKSNSKNTAYIYENILYSIGDLSGIAYHNINDISNINNIMDDGTNYTNDNSYNVINKMENIDNTYAIKELRGY